MNQEGRLISAIHAITSVLASNPSIDDSLHNILQVCVEAVDAAGGTIYLHDPREHALSFGYVLPEDMNAQLQGQSFPDTQGVSGSVFTSRQSRVDNDVAKAEEHSQDFDAQTQHVTRALITVPLLVADAPPVGVVQVLNKKKGPFTEEDLRVLEIVGSIAAMTIRNSQLAQDAKKATGLSAMGDIAHDIKNKVAPLTMGAMTLMIEIEALSTIMTDQKETLDSVREAAEIIAAGANKTHRYTQLIADLAKGKDLAVSKQEGDICEVVAREFNTQQAGARLKSVELVTEIDHPIRAPFDEVMLERAIYNLTINAIEATPEGGQVRLSVCEGPGEVVVTVADTGMGMPADRLAHVLAGTAESSKAGGTGLGTSIVRKMAEMHGGRLEAESKPGIGTTFRIVLPKG